MCDKDWPKRQKVWLRSDLTDLCWFAQVLLGDLPPDFLRVGMSAQDLQVAADAQTAQMLQAQQVGYNFAAATLPRLSITVVQVDMNFSVLDSISTYDATRETSVLGLALCVAPNSGVFCMKPTQLLLPRTQRSRSVSGVCFLPNVDPRFGSEGTGP